jgi:hypothetical protein
MVGTETITGVLDAVGRGRAVAVGIGGRVAAKVGDLVAVHVAVAGMAG